MNDITNHFSNCIPSNKALLAISRKSPQEIHASGEEVINTILESLKEPFLQDMALTVAHEVKNHLSDDQRKRLMNEIQSPTFPSKLPDIVPSY